jgi:hypothetical protein
LPNDTLVGLTLTVWENAGIKLKAAKHTTRAVRYVASPIMELRHVCFVRACLKRCDTQSCIHPGIKNPECD